MASSDSVLAAILNQELADLEGIQSQNPETGAGIGSGQSYVNQYTNNIFGAPFQLIDSVDKRFAEVNPMVGTEYLRNFILNSPILHIRPGMPKYTGGAKAKDLFESIKRVYFGTATGNMSFAEAVLLEAAQSTIFSGGSKLQKRMFGFREDYWQYMSYVNYMCRSVATFLNLTSGTRFPTGCYLSDNSSSLHQFANMQWQEYRMLTSSAPLKPTKELREMLKATFIGAAGASVVDAVGDLANVVGQDVSAVATYMSKYQMYDQYTPMDEMLKAMENNSQAAAELSESVSQNGQGLGSQIAQDVVENFEHAADTSVVDVIEDKICSVLFMVEPTSFTETLTNETAPSVIENGMDNLNSLGHEIAFITQSKVDFGTLENMANVLGSTASGLANGLTGIVENVAGGFASNLFSGAIRSIKGQKMIYPDIYQSSSSSMDYRFTVNLTSPYGDVWNYYMNILVPLMHLIALAAPRMITSNAISSPFLVQAFIPGMCTVQLGIVSSMEINKNPDADHVSVNGFPLDIKVEFTIKELYNSLAISPANDPASFLWNETLNTYLSSASGLFPAVDTYTKQRMTAFENLDQYFDQGEFMQDMSNQTLKKVENFINPFEGR